MTIAASVRQITPLRADLPAATAALARITARRAQLNARPNPIYLFITRSSIKHSAESTGSHCDRPDPRSKSP